MAIDFDQYPIYDHIVDKDGVHLSPKWKDFFSN